MQDISAPKVVTVSAYFMEVGFYDVNVDSSKIVILCIHSIKQYSTFYKNNGHLFDKTNW